LGRGAGKRIFMEYRVPLKRLEVGGSLTREEIRSLLIEREKAPI